MFGPAACITSPIGWVYTKPSIPSEAIAATTLVERPTMLR